MKNWFLEEYLIYFKSELMLNSKFSHVANLLIRSHLAFTTHSREKSEMAKCLKVFCFRPNWTLHNKIKVGDLICNILQNHQNGKILNFSKVESTPPKYAGASRLSHVGQFLISCKNFEVSHRSANGICSNIFMLMYKAKWPIYIKAKIEHSKYLPKIQRLSKNFEMLWDAWKRV